MADMQSSQTDVIAQLTRALAQDFQLQPLEDPNRPVFLAIAWPAHDGVTGVKPRLPSGRGLTPGQALVAAGAEALELRASLAQNHLSTLADLPREDGLALVTGRDLLTGRAVPMLAQTVWLDCAAVLGEPLVTEATSTGCAVGRTRLQATETALWECIERDALALWWHGGWPACSLPLDQIDRLHPRLTWWLDGRDRVTRLLDLTTDIGLPVVAAVSSDRNGRQVALGSAARPERAAATLAAVTEMVQTEVAMDAAKAAGDPEVLDWTDAASTELQPQFRGQAPARPAPPGNLLQRLADLGLAALAVDLTLAGDPLPSMRVLVPGLCAMGGRIDTPRFRRLCPSSRCPSFPEPY
jgi:ribosomal protein S12 methylthiotransferase accessory factor YcaO